MGNGNTAEFRMVSKLGVWAMVALWAMTTALGGFGLRLVINNSKTLDTTIKTYNLKFERIDEIMNELKQEDGIDDLQNKQLSKHWKIHSWTRDRINTLRNKHDLEIAEWPDLGD